MSNPKNRIIDLLDKVKSVDDLKAIAERVNARIADQTGQPAVGMFTLARLHAAQGEYDRGYLDGYIQLQLDYHPITALKLDLNTAHGLIFSIIEQMQSTVAKRKMYEKQPQGRNMLLSDLEKLEVALNGRYLGFTHIAALFDGQVDDIRDEVGVYVGSIHDMLIAIRQDKATFDDLEQTLLPTPIHDRDFNQRLAVITKAKRNRKPAEHTQQIADKMEAFRVRGKSTQESAAKRALIELRLDLDVSTAIKAYRTVYGKWK